MMHLDNDDTICAPATVPGTGAITVIRVSGKEALTIADRVVTCRQTAGSGPDKGTDKGPIASAKGYTIRFGTVYTPDGKPLDEVLVSIFRAPHSYTGEDSVEISCHASRYIAEQLMLLLMKAGARAAAPGEFTQRAFLNGKMDLAQAEAVADLIASQNESAHRIAFSQMKGGFSSELKEMRASLLNIVSLMELELDFSEEEVEFADRAQLNGLLDKVTAHISRLIESFRLGNAIKNGVPVAIAGTTNTGKSTLLNALLGEDRAIVSDVHGTTRDTVEETMNVDGILFRFIDTAGIRQTDEIVEKIGIERTFRKISEADIILGMIDMTRPDQENEESLREIMSKTDLNRQKLFILLNKSDLLTPAGAQEKKDAVSAILQDNAAAAATTSDGTSDAPLTSRPCNSIQLFFISAKQHEGISELKTALAATQKGLLGDSDTTLVTNIRHIEALTRANEALLRVRTGLATGLPTDLAAQDIREALYYIGSIVGEISTDEVLGNIFRNFCIGK